MKTWLAIIGCFFMLTGCDDGGTKNPAMGSKGGPCYGNGTCDNTLACISDLCVDLNEISDADTSTPDTTSDNQADDLLYTDTDEATTSDTGDDTSGTDTDNGEEPDTAMTDTDTGDESDAAVTPDADTVDVEVPESEMVTVPAGEFLMGCNEAALVEEDWPCENDEFPYHAVTLSAYKIGKYEVTVEEYRKCITAGACNNNNNDEWHHFPPDFDSEGACNLSADVEDRESHPMNCVSWYGAKAYCEWVGLRLPSEAEWEKAARGTDGRKFPWGNEPAESCDYVVMAQYNEQTGEYDLCGSGGTMPVGSKPLGQSSYGVYDMVGNVYEWVNDWYDESYYESSPANNPTGPESGAGYPGTWERVTRGGSYRADGRDYRTFSRGEEKPNSWGSTYLGIRCAK